MQPGVLNSRKYDIGKAAVFAVEGGWDGTTPLFASDGPLVWIGATEGEIKIEPNPAYSELTLPEQTGPAAILRYLTGTRPTFTLGIFPTLEGMSLLSPTGLASMGFEQQVLAKTHTLWIVPWALFQKKGVLGFDQPVPVVYNGANWTKDAVAIAEDSEDERRLFLSALIWKADLAPITTVYRHEDGGKALTQVEVTVQQDFDRPEGCQQVLILGEAFGEYAPFAIDFTP